MVDDKAGKSGYRRSLLYSILRKTTYYLLWAAHSYYLYSLFENVRFFSHLADFEREMLYRTEMAKNLIWCFLLLASECLIYCLFPKFKKYENHPLTDTGDGAETPRNFYWLLQKKWRFLNLNIKAQLEMKGLYFSYYKTLVIAPTLSDGVNQIVHDNVTEYGHVINTFQRFNLYPEVVLGTAFRWFTALCDRFGWKVETCWRVNRGENMPPIQSCEGIGNMHYFYIYGAFGVAGRVVASIFALGEAVSESYFGGLLSAAAFLFNHGEATRVQWTPPLRESFAYPFFISQVLVLTSILKNDGVTKTDYWRSTWLILDTIALSACWQFAQFVLATQLGALFLLFLFGFISTPLIFRLWKCYTVAFLVSVVLLFGNTMLFVSLFSTSLIALLIAIGIERIIGSWRWPALVYVSLQWYIYMAVVFGGKLAISRIFDIRDDNHVLDILRSKLTEFESFHTRLYTCAVEFDFLPFETILKLTKSWLLPVAFCSILLYSAYLMRYLFSASSRLSGVNTTKSVKPPVKRNNQGKQKSEAHEPSLHTNHDYLPEIAYNVIQLLCFTLMAVFIMRLKLFATPQLCVVASLIANEKVLLKVVGKQLSKLRLVVVILIIAGMAYEGRKNISEQLQMRGEYSNPRQEQLFEWIMQNTKPDAVYGGSMPIMANVKLSTLRPIVNHPQYENEEIRNRTLMVYSMYSRKPIEEVHGSLKRLGVQYFIFQQSTCLNTHPNPKCNYLAMWDLEDPANRDNPPLCERVMEAIASSGAKTGTLVDSAFRIVYNNGEYVVLEVLQRNSGQ